MIPLIPFAIEITADPLLIKAGKKDLSWKTRTALIALSCLACWLIEGSQFNDEGLKVVGRSVCLALIPFCFFDQCLNLLRFGWKKWIDGKWKYQSTTNNKLWDMTFAKLNPWFLLVLRCIAFGGFITGWILI